MRRPTRASWFLSLVFAACSSGGISEDGGVDASFVDAWAGDARGDAAALDALTWREGAPCPMARFESLGVVVEDRLWVMGGFTSADLRVTPRIDIYDVATDSWERGPDLRGAETHFGTFFYNGEVWFVGGFSGWPARVMSDVWRYRYADDTWSQGPALPQSGAGASVALVGTTLHHAGGLNDASDADVDEHFVLDLVNPTAWRSLASLDNPRNHLAGVASGSRMWAIGGRHIWDEADGQLSDVHAYDSDGDAWITGPSLPSGRSEIAASSFATEDGIFVIGGSTAGVQPTADVLFLANGASLWRALTPLPEPRKGAVAARIGNQIVVTTGSPTSTDPSSTTYIGCCL
ncbi:MAG: hypothetical protein IPK60_00825 [Sandaracinaceae bacterium]|nr:hypothetical protein [Sandaracinaceae bacterium]